MCMLNNLKHIFIDVYTGKLAHLYILNNCLEHGFVFCNLQKSVLNKVYFVIVSSARLNSLCSFSLSLSDILSHTIV